MEKYDAETGEKNKTNANALAGSLKKYAKEYIPLNQVRKIIQKEIAEEIAKEGLLDE